MDRWQQKNSNWVLDTGDVIFYVSARGQTDKPWQVHTSFGPGTVLQTDHTRFATAEEAKRHAEFLETPTKEEVTP